MSKDEKKGKKSKNHCVNKKGLMLTFGLTTLGTRVLSAVSLVAIGLSFCAMNKQAKVFNECVEEIRDRGKTTSDAVRFCNGG